MIAGTITMHDPLLEIGDVKETIYGPEFLENYNPNGPMKSNFGIDLAIVYVENNFKSLNLVSPQANLKNILANNS